MERKNSITLSGITNFLEAGALLRHGEHHRDQWILLEGPFTPASDANRDEITVFSPDFYDLAPNSETSEWQGSQTYLLSSEQVRDICDLYLQEHAPALSPPLAKAAWIEPSKEDFNQALQLIHQRIQKDEIQKAVPVVFARSAQTVTAIERAQMIKNLLEAPTTLKVYGFWNKGRGVIGATPETLFDYSASVLKTMALAGTCPKTEADSRDSLLNDKKEMLEHVLVVEDLKEVLSPFGKVKTQGPAILELPTLFHLKTDIEVACNKTPNFQALIKTLHPTPALGVAPRAAGYKWMAELPGQENRGGFGAPFAFFGLGDRRKEAVCLVAIRNLQWNENQSMIGSGCGVVAASELEREWRELFQKRLSVRKILGLEQ